MHRIVIGTPWVSAFMHTAWVDAALQLQHPPDCGVGWVRGNGWCDARRIHHIIESALGIDADYVGFIDGDVIVPPEWLEVMFKHVQSGKRVVASVVPMRGRADERFPAFCPMAWNVIDGKAELIDVRDGVQPVDLVSLGAVLMDASIFREADKLWTWHTYDSDNGYRAVGGTADTILMKNLKDHGVQVWADPTLDVRHLQTFQIDRTFTDRFPGWRVGPI